MAGGSELSDKSNFVAVDALRCPNADPLIVNQTENRWRTLVLRCPRRPTRRAGSRMGTRRPSSRLSEVANQAAQSVNIKGARILLGIL